MSEMHDDLTSIHQILLGARKLAVHGEDMTSMNCDVNIAEHAIWVGRLAAIEDLILEFEAAGVEWPDNVVAVEFKCGCGGDLHPQCGPPC